MLKSPAIRLLAATNNARGDLFTRLVLDLFFALGYDDLRLNVSKTGRELDIQGAHRFEPRRVAAECKAHDEPIGGRDVNTFLGVLTRERDERKPLPVAGYFVSLNGFKESEVEQERRTGDANRVILLDGSQVVSTLEKANVLISRVEAIEQAGRCAADLELKLESAELLGHKFGYLWAIVYSSAKERTHLTLVHADGTVLAKTVAREVISADDKSGGLLQKLVYIPPKTTTQRRATVEQAAMEQYRRWLTEECGFIQLDGLPADTDLSATRIKLEKLFVPLKLIMPPKVKSKNNRSQPKPIPVGAVLKNYRHLAIVAPPGGGKSTLLKRLAVAYASQSRLRELDDALPKRIWLPLLVRCRELRDRIQRPILELLDDLPRHASLSGEETGVFRDAIHTALRSGTALLIVDGLDEISDEGHRETFAKHLRTFVAMFPNAGLIVSSREAGFRLVAGVVASVCLESRLAPLDEADVHRLCESWHTEIIANTDKVRADARSLSDLIWYNGRIRALAENPLMLTTLLVVRRCIGELPTRRVELYREAVRVLIRTWNTEGFEPMDLEEALAQLSYVACAMFETGQQRIAHKPLRKLLQQARIELTAELQFTRISPDEFINRIEYRSSLLMQTGHAAVDGELQPIYEFRHLTFQEYLTARGLVEEQHPGRDTSGSLATLLEPHFTDDRWREVVALASVLAGRKADELIQKLTTTLSESQEKSSEDAGFAVAELLRQCLLDEVQVPPTTLRRALNIIARLNHGVTGIDALLRGKFGGVLEETIEHEYLNGNAGWEQYYLAISRVPVNKVAFSELNDCLTDDLAERLILLLSDGTRSSRVYAAMSGMHGAYNCVMQKTGLSESVAVELRDSLGALLSLRDLPVSLAATWALVWIGAARTPKAPPQPHVLLKLLQLATQDSSPEMARLAAWALTTQPLLPRDTFGSEVWATVKSPSVLRAASGLGEVVTGWYSQIWRDDDFIRAFSHHRLTRDDSTASTAIEILQSLGKRGQAILDGFEKSEA